MVEQPLKLTLRELIEQYEQHTYPVTLVCAGNRRKEQNVVRKTKGFSWGAAGVSTALWTGVILGDLLKKAKPMRGAKYVCMEGADKLPNGYYGTSVKLNWAMDPNRGMMLAHRMNGDVLRPDHGKPLRVIIPGQIGGRSVKWLKKLIITAEPSDNWYHIYDNRVLPTMVSPEQSAAEPEWWTDERYAIYDLGTNSAIAYPAHEEQLSIAGDISDQTYNIRGYAYGGGGRKVTRVEVSLDKGATWTLSDIDYAEDRYRDALPQSLCGGTLDFGWREASFCWCFWHVKIPVADLANASDILVRAMDESMNLQPRDMYWSVLGMMNNPWFRIVIHKKEDGSLQFEHPTQPALMPGGWMERIKKEGGDLTNGYWGEQIGGEVVKKAVVEEVKETTMVKDGVDRKITLEELRTHDKEDAPWFVVRNEVYDGTAFLEGHPGGASSIINAAALDSTDEFMAIRKHHHKFSIAWRQKTDIYTDSENAKGMMPTYHIGTLTDNAIAALASGEAIEGADATPRETFLDPKTWRKALLHSKKSVSPDTRIFTFKLDYDTQSLGLPTGQHLMIRLRDPVTREAIIRSYTPLSETSQRGYLDVLIKCYLPTATHALGGKMTSALDALPLGHSLDLKGPIGKFEYLGRGHYTLNGMRNRPDPSSPSTSPLKTLYMICGGSGITPIFQILRAVLTDPSDHVKCIVIDGNRLVEDILCREELDAFARDYREKCELLYLLTRPTDEWTGLRGRIAKPLIRERVDRSRHGEGEALVLVCGPESLEATVREALGEGGWRGEEMVFF
jgi:nitrate reductase (NAD(P)H)